jgi:hypothetical protein
MPVAISGGGAGPIETWDPTVSVASTATIETGGALDWHGRANIRRRSDGVLLLTNRAGTIHWSNDAQINIHFSDDDGATWTAANTKIGGGAVTNFPSNPGGSGNTGLGEGWMEILPSGRIVMLNWSMTGTYPGSFGFDGTWQTVSDDGGESWTATSKITIDGNPGDDDMTFVTDDGFVHPNEQRIYCGARIYSENDGAPSTSILIRSTDNVPNWEYVSTIQGPAEGGTGGQEVGLEYVGNDTIIAELRDNPQTHCYQRISTDNGATWGTLIDMTSVLGIAGRQRVYTIAHLKGEVGWWKDPRLIMCGFSHMTSGSSADRRVAVWLSPDRAATWDGPFQLNSTTEDGGYGDLFWDATNGRFVVISYDGTYNAASLKQWNLTIGGLG